jgi:putative NADH-flavin reductase
MRRFAELTRAAHTLTGIVRNCGAVMNPPPELVVAQRIDLLRQTDVAYWCRIFDVTIDELREAVRHAGHHVAEVRRYLISHPPTLQ